MPKFTYSDQFTYQQMEDTETQPGGTFADWRIATLGDLGDLFAEWFGDFYRDHELNVEHSRTLPDGRVDAIWLILESIYGTGDLGTMQLVSTSPWVHRAELGFDDGGSAANIGRLYLEIKCQDGPLSNLVEARYGIAVDWFDKSHGTTLLARD